MYKLIKKGLYSDHSTLTNIVWCITSGIVIATLTYVSFIIATS